VAEYRSAIFYSDDEQKKASEAYIQDLNNGRAFRTPIVTQVVSLRGAFFHVESEHQHSLDRNPTQA
jgi:peptide-methionine (S)-S-oxide reductase